MIPFFDAKRKKTILEGFSSVSHGWNAVTVSQRAVEGINNDSTRERLLREKDLSLQKAIDICKAAEIASQHMKTIVDSTAETHAISKRQKVKFRGKEQQDLKVI